MWICFSQIVAAAVLACAAAAPSGALLAGAYGAPWAHASLAYAAPLAVNHGDIQGAAIDAHVNAVDHTRAVVDQVAENQGKAINAAEEHAWQSVNAAQTAAAAIDGAAAGVSPAVAHQLAGHVAPVATYAAHSIAAPALAHGYAAPILAHGIGGSHSVSTQSLSQTHPGPIIHSHLAYAGLGLAHGLGHAW